MEKESRLFLLMFWVLATAFFSSAVYGQDRAELLVLGVVHFSNPGRDSINFEIDDILSALLSDNYLGLSATTILAG